jgi:hypothetical protein
MALEGVRSENVNNSQPAEANKPAEAPKTQAPEPQKADAKAVDQAAANYKPDEAAPAEANATPNGDLQNEVQNRRTEAQLNDGAKPADPTITINGDNVTIETGDADDTVKVSQDAKSGEVTVNVNGKDYKYTGAQSENITIRAGKGNDVIEVGKDVKVSFRLEGGEGDDKITGGAGRDYINGSKGKDTIYGGGGDDVIYGGDDDDFLNGGDGNDYIDGGKGNDSAFGDAGNDIVSGGLGDDWVSGGTGDDHLYSGGGKDTLTNLGGKDTFYMQTAEDKTLGDAANIKVVNVELIGNPGETSVKIEGSDEFKERVEADLEFYRSSPTGRAMLEAFDKRNKDTGSEGFSIFGMTFGKKEGYTVTIKETDSGAAAGPTDRPKTWLDVANNKPGEGSSGRVEYPVAERTLYGNDPTDPNDNWNDAPPSVILYHELAHNYDYLHGTLMPGTYSGTDKTDQGLNNRERVATGLPIDHDNDPKTPEQISPHHPFIYTENALREELGLDRRPSYGNPKNP